MQTQTPKLHESAKRPFASETWKLLSEQRDLQANEAINLMQNDDNRL